MSKKEKFEEAEFFLSKLNESQSDPNHNQRHFQYYCSAFSSAVRSILQYSHDEVEGTTNQTWYDNKVNNECEIIFFKIYRDLNIHCFPQKQKDIPCIVLTEGSINTTPYFTKLYLFEPINWNKVDKISSKCKQCGLNPTPPCIHNKDVVTLCSKYLEIVKNIVEEGKNNGYLTE
ncbi:hypothetical protein DSECCO2_13010 [anaerobic digester metagenome]